MKLSIIVPVYGVEKYIEKCISSLLIPKLEDYEIIIVNDGTKDKSIDIVHACFEDHRIQVVEQDNHGLSAARNNGLACAKGEYVWFFDSDDWADSECIPNILRELKNIDVLYMPMHYMNFEDTREEKLVGNALNVGTGKELCCMHYQHPVPFYIFRKDFLINNSLYFTVGILHEDTLFTPIALTYVNSLKCFNKAVYHYRQRGGSISKTASLKRVDDLFLVLRSLVSYGDTLSVDFRYRWGSCVVASANSLLFNIRSLQIEDEHDAFKYLNNNKCLLKYFIYSKSLNNKLLGIFAILLHNNLVKAYRFLARLRYNKNI